MNNENKPTLWCMMIHQSLWEDLEDGWYYCQYCDEEFRY